MTLFTVTFVDHPEWSLIVCKVLPSVNLVLLVGFQVVRARFAKHAGQIVTAMQIDRAAVAEAAGNTLAYPLGHSLVQIWVRVSI